MFPAFDRRQAEDAELPRPLPPRAPRQVLRLLGLSLCGLLGLASWLAAAEAGNGTPLPPPPQVGVEYPQDPLATLDPGHPRVMAVAADFARITTASQDPAFAAWVSAFTEEAAKAAARPVSFYDIPDGKRLLKVCQTVKKLVFAQSLLFRLTGERRHLDRVWAELEAARNFPDWNPKHFLDTAEMTAAFGIAYDWLHDAWTDQQRTLIRQAIVDKGLTPGLGFYRKADLEGVKDAKVGGWTRLNHNWNQVCNGGMLIGALAIADREPEVAAEVIRGAVTALPYALVEYGPDGAWGEGPGYWSFATEFTVYALSALQTALGRDFGLGAIPGLSKTGDFPPAFTGPTGMPFNFADASMGRFGGSSTLLWLATRYDRPDWAAAQLAAHGERPEPFDLLWGAAWFARKPAPVDQPLQRYFRHHEIVAMRSAWHDPRAWWLGIKGGDNRVNHGHLDLGSFVLDALGQRWGYDLGGDDYNLPGYFGGQRWSYYRLRAEAHNTLVMNPGAGPDQDPQAKAAVIAQGTTVDRQFAVVDLSAAYARDSRRVHRGFALEGGSALIQDEVDLDRSTDLWWMFHTAATITVQGATAELEFRGERLRAQILAPAEAVFSEIPAEPLASSPHPPGQLHKPMGGAPKEAMRTLAIHLPAASGALRLAVRFRAADRGAVATEVTALGEWR